MAEPEVKIQGAVVPKGREGLSPEEINRRAKVRKRALELIDTGLPQAEAAKKAFSEIVESEQKESARTRDIILAESQVKDIENQRNRFVNERSEALQLQGVPQIEARSMAESEYEESYLKPAQRPYGAISETKAPSFLPRPAEPIELPRVVGEKEAKLSEAARPQTFLPTQVEKQLEEGFDKTLIERRAEELVDQGMSKGAAAQQAYKEFGPGSPAQKEAVRRAQPQEAGGLVLGTGPDFNELSKRLQDEGATPDEAASQSESIQAAYDAKVQELRSSYAKEDKVPDNLAELAFEEALSEIQKIPSVLADKKNYITDYQRTGPNDPVFLAFSKQVERGEGVPRLTQAQGKYIAKQAEIARRAAEKRLKDEYKDKPLVVTETEAVEGLRGARPRVVSRELSGEEKDAEIQRRAAAEFETPFWTDPKEVERRLANPEKFKKPGILAAETVFGTQQESTIGYLLRSGLLVPNAVAGYLFPKLFTGFEDTSEGDGVEELRRRARPEAFKDSPVLLNIAQGRGFVGEASELSKLTGIDKLDVIGGITAGDIYTAGAFAADILDPTFDITSGLYRGARTGVDVVRAGKLVGLGTAETVGAAAKQAAKEGAKTVVREWGLTNLFFKEKVSPGDVRLFLSDEMAKKVSDEVFDATGARRAIGASASDIAVGVNKELNALDNYLAKGPGEGVPLSKAKLADAFAESAARNPSIIQKLQDIENAKAAVKAGSATPADRALAELSDVRKLIASDDAIYNEVQKSLVRQSTREAVFKATGETSLQNGIIAVTKSTFATSDVANKILDEVAKSPFMKTFIPKITKQPSSGTQLVSGVRRGAARQGTVVDGYKIDAASRGEIVSNVRNLRDRKIISNDETLSILKSLRENPDFVSSSLVRRLIDAEIDSVAMKYKTAKASDIAKTSSIVAKEIGTPLQMRDFSNPLLRKNIAELTNGGKVQTDPLLPAQRQIVEETVGKLGKMDAKLRDDLNALLKDESVRALYGIAPGSKLTRKQLIGHLIVGPIGKSDPGRTNRILKSVSNRFVYAKDSVADIFDMFKGFKVDEVTDVWSSLPNPSHPLGLSGRAQLESLISRANGAVMRNPADFQTIMEALGRDIQALAGDAANLKVDKSALKFGEPATNERLIQAYYSSEANRIVADSLSRITREDGGLLNERWSALPQNTRRAIKFKESFSDAISRYIEGVTNNPRFLNRESFEIVDEIFGATIPAARLGVSQFEMRELLSEISDIAESVMRKNGIKRAEDFTGQVAELVEQAVSGKYDANLAAALGIRGAEQIKNALQSGGATAIERGLARAIDESTIKAKLVGAVNPLNLLDSLTEAWYTLVLTGAPRFHGANIAGAPEVIYSTTGKLISPLPIPGTSTFDAALIMKRAGGPKGGAVAVTDKAGRTYTNNEIYRAILEGGGESLKKADIPSVAARAALIQLDEGVKGGGRRALDYVINSPSSEDMMYRMAVALEELRDGRTLESATKLARGSLYDKGTINEGEKFLQRSIMFYSFTRNNFVNLLKNMMQPEGWKRLSQIAKTKRGVETVLLDEMTDDEKRYLPENAATRIVLGKANAYGEKGNIIATPGLSTLSAVELLTKFLALDYKYFFDMTLGRAAQQTKEEIRIPERVPAEHVFILKNIAEVFGGEPEDLMSAIAGERVIPLNSRDPGAVEGLVYPLLSENARERYVLGIRALKLIGLERLVNDIPNSMRAPGGKVATAIEANNVGYGLSAAYAAGFLTPIKTLSAESQRLKSLMNSSKEGKELLKDITQALAEDALAVAPQDVEELTKKTQEQKLAVESVKTRAMSPKEQQIMNLVREILSLQAKIMTDPSNADYYIEQMDKKTAQLDALQAE